MALNLTICPYTYNEWHTLTHVIFTGDDVLSAIVLNHPKEDCFYAIPNMNGEFGEIMICLFDEFGNYCRNRICCLDNNAHYIASEQIP